MNEDVHSAQENLRLSASQISKLQGEFKLVCDELDQARRKVNEYENSLKRIAADSDNKIKSLNEECQRLKGVIEKRNA